MVRKIFLLFAVSFFPSLLLAQVTNPYNVPGISNKNITIQKPGHVYSSHTTKTGITKTKDIDLTEVKDYIVEFTDKPLFIKSAQSMQKLEKVTYQNTFEQFSHDLAALNHNSSTLLKVSLIAPEIKREYYKVFFGASFSGTRALRDAVRSLSYVKNIYYDYPVKAVTDQNDVKVRSGKKLESDNVTGKGIKVGIIDTGIDYKHPALGGGFGAGFKVIGGYDFVNNDTDPIDDNGHGTHVAGIIAAKSDSVTGVAPDASLMAFKVLDQYGSGSESTVLAGIERAVDPNNDGLTDDKVDIVNMSLGGSGGPDDPLSTAVDNATSLGITFCIAAGNSGAYNTIGSPGTAISAITVGALSDDGKVAYFSSMGPDKSNFYIKPEVIAPGVNIYSTYLDSTYATLSGTSMATPYVSGVCALVKSLHPEWSPELIKSAIVNTADNASEDIMAQGAGKVNLQDAENITSLAKPATLNFGLDDAKQSTWVKLDTVEITNRNSSSQNYSMTISGQQAGISLSAVPSSFSIAPGATQKVIFTLAINNNTVQYLETGSRAYYGFAYITGSNDSFQLPWAFIKSPVLIIKFDVPPDIFLISNNDLVYRPEDASWSKDSSSVQIMTAKGTFNIFTHFLTFNNGSYYENFVETPGVKIDGYDSISISSTEAKNTINLNGVNENGALLSNMNNADKLYEILFPDSSYMKSASWSFSAKNYFRISDLPDGFSVFSGEFQFDPITENICRVIEFDKIKSIKSDIELSNKSVDFIKQNVHVSFPHSKILSRVGFGETIGFRVDSVGTMFFGWLSDSDFLTLTSTEWDGELFITPAKDTSNFYTTFIWADISSIAGNNTIPWFITPAFRENADSLGLYYTLQPTPDILFYHSNSEMILGKGPVFPSMEGPNYSSGSSVYIQQGYISYKGQLNEERYADDQTSSYVLNDKNGKIVSEGVLGNFSAIKASPDVYTFTATNTSYIIDTAIGGKAVISDKFDLRKTDMTPPRITSLQLRNTNNAVTNRVAKNDKLSIFFSINDDFSFDVDSVKAYAKNYYSSDWQNITLSKSIKNKTVGNIFTGDLSSYTNIDTAAIDLKIIASDMSGNTMEYTLQPSFVVGNFTGTITGIVKTYPTIASYVLYNNYPNPFNPGTYISYNIPEDSYVKVEIYNVLGQSVAKVFEGSQARGQYKFYWDAQKFASGMYFCNFTAKGKVNYQKVNKLILLK